MSDSGRAVVQRVPRRGEGDAIVLANRKTEVHECVGCRWSGIAVVRKAAGTSSSKIAVGADLQQTRVAGWELDHRKRRRIEARDEARQSRREILIREQGCTWGDCCKRDRDRFGQVRCVAGWVEGD